MNGNGNSITELHCGTRKGGWYCPRTKLKCTMRGNTSCAATGRGAERRKNQAVYEAKSIAVAKQAERKVLNAFGRFLLNRASSLFAYSKHGHR